MNLKPVKSKSLVQAVVDELVVQIESGYLKPGDKISSQRELASELKVGRSCIREALQALSLAKIVEIRPGKGVYVSNLSVNSLINPAKIPLRVDRDSLFDLLKVRMILELSAVKEVAVVATEDERNKLSSIVENMNKCIKNNRIDNYILEDIEFHKTIIKCTHNKILIEIFDFIYEIMLKGIKLNLEFKGALEKGYKRHKEVLEKIKIKDKVGAELALKKHFELTKKNIKKMKPT